MKVSHFFVIILATFLIVILNAGICKQALAVEPVLIGAPTAINDVSGSQQRKSLIMAAEEINAKGGITIKG